MFAFAKSQAVPWHKHAALLTHGTWQHSVARAVKLWLYPGFAGHWGLHHLSVNVTCPTVWWPSSQHISSVDLLGIDPVVVLNLFSCPVATGRVCDGPAVWDWGQSCCGNISAASLTTSIWLPFRHQPGGKNVAKRVPCKTKIKFLCILCGHLSSQRSGSSSLVWWMLKVYNFMDLFCIDDKFA